ncbi:fimbria/pilus periplasmic chaperone [Francisellaceae bacterium]|nr:fimbria/pilus periplasmic chaperone [Francisellaceae bacterium]
MKKIVAFLIGTFFLIGINAFAGAIVDISTPQVVFNAKSKKTQYITVKNIGNEKGYVGVRVYDALKPRDGQKQKATLSKKFKMIISPRRMVLKPGQSKRVRITNTTGVVQKDRVIDIVSQLVKPNVKGQKVVAGGAGIQVKGAIVHLTQVYVLPKTLEVNLSHKIETNKGSKLLKFSNTGNTTVFLRKGQLCQSNDKCEALEGMAVYPSMTKTVELPKTFGTITYDQVDLDKQASKVEVTL